MRGARHRQLIVIPPEVIESARLDEGQHLERLGARPPKGDGPRESGLSNQPAIGPDDGCVHPMPGLDLAVAHGDDVQIIPLHQSPFIRTPSPSLSCTAWDPGECYRGSR